MKAPQRWAVVVFAIVMGASIPLTTAPIQALAAASASLSQCANGNPATLGCVNWVNGNLGASKSRYFEGDSIPYQMVMPGLDTTVPHTITISWDTTKGGKHALDYLTSPNYTVSNPGFSPDPCQGVSGCTAGSETTFAIPVDPNVTGAGVTPVGGQNFWIYNGTITKVSAYTLAGSYTGDSSTSVTISFLASSSTNVVLAWGGHIATRADWGVNNSAVAISGSPYHTSLVDLDGSGGAQDRSLEAAAVIFPGSITIIKDAVPKSTQSFSYSTSSSTGSTALSPATFSLVDNGATPTCTPTPASNTECFSGLDFFPATYTITETPVSLWTLSFSTPVCTVTSPNGGTQTASGSTVTVNLKDGENVTCVFTNTHRQVSPTLATTLHDTTAGTSQAGGPTPLSAKIGDSVYDSSALTGAAAGPAGAATISYAFYTNSICTLNAVSETPTANTFTSPGPPPDSNAFTFTQAGTYYWQAVYSGDANNVGATSPCNEVLVVAQNSPTLATTLHDTTAGTSQAGGPTPLSAKIGDSVYDSSALTGAAAGPAGAATISYAFYTNSICTLNAVSETPTANTFTSPGPPPDSNAFTFTQAGTYYWQAVYSGDANNVGATSPCNEVLVVAQNSPTLATTLHDTTAGTSQAGGPTPLSAKIGDSVYDSSALTGAAAGPAGAATISYAFYTNSICTLNAVSETPTANTFTSPGPPPDSNAFTFTQAGTYYWQAVYSGDANNVGATSPCNEVLVVAQNSPTLATTLHDTTAGTSQAGGPTPLSAKIGDSVYDSSALTGAAAGPAGAATISYAFYTNSICTLNAVSETPTANTFTSPGPPPDSNAFTFTQAGTYYWQAVYSGDANNVGATSPCNEVLVVAQNSPTLATTLHDTTAGTSQAGGPTPLSAKIGDSVYDSSALTGAAAGPAGAATISYAFYTNSICTLNAVSETPTANTFTSPGPPPDSNAFTFTQAGTYYWQAVYSGDANNVGATSPCNEVLVVAQNSPTLATTLHDTTAGTSQAGGPTPLSAKIGDSVYDSSALTGAAAGPAGAATISYAFYTNSICTLNAVSETPTANTFTSPGPPPDSNAFTFTQAGTYYWQAVYSGDANNVGATSPCNEVLVVAQNSPTLATTLHDTTAGTSQAGGPTPLSAKIGDSVYDSSALTGAAAGPAGAATISYAFYTNSICTLNAVSETPTANTFTSPGPPPDSNAFTFTQAGTYYWQAVYSGDANNVGATSPCNEVLVVAQNSPTLATTLHDTTAGTSQAGGPTPLSAKIGDSVYDSSALTGAAAGPAGAATISYAFYTNSICTLNAVSETPTANTFTSPGPPPDSNAFTFTQAGTYYWQAVYSGDANNVGATSPCNEVLVVAQNSPTLATTLHDTTAGTSQAGGPTPLSAKIGDSVYDSSALTGAAAGPAGAATISYAFYTNSICTLNAVSETPTANTFTSPGPPPDSNAFTFTQAGTYYWQAVYSGDANNVGATSPCNEVLVVAQNSPTLATTLHDTTAGTSQAGGPTPLSAKIGDSVYDSSALTGAAAGPAGAATISYAFYTNSICTLNAVSETPTANTFTSPGPPPDSNAFTFTQAGTYYWQAVYSGDANNVGATSPCNEVLVVAQNSPTLATTLHDTTAGTSQAGGPTPLSAKIGDSVYDSSALTGAAAGPAGAATISYAFYTNSICTLNAVSETPTANTFTSPGPPPDSNAFTFTQAGTYYWQAVYSGDANNVGATSPCNEVLVVAQNSPTLATTLHDTTAGTSQAGGPTPLSAKIGDSVYDSSALTGAAAGPAGAATISYAFYTNSICTLNAVSETPTANTFTSPGPPPDSNAFTFTQAGTYYWQAVYSGDANNVGATSPCNEVLVVAQNSPTLATTLHDTTAGTSQAGGPTPLSAKIGDSVYDSSALTGAAAGPAGAATISYAFYTNSICTLNAVSETPTANTFTSPGPPPDSNAFTFTQAGTYYWQAVYSGDANNVGATSPCNEVLVVAQNSPTLATTLHDTTAGTSQAGGPTPLSAKIGDSVYDSSALTGAAAGPAGAATISYAFYTNSICTLNAVSETPTANTFTSPGPPPDSNAFTFTQAGTYYWQAVYSGDANNVGATSPCNEVLVVAQNSPTLATTLHDTTAGTSQAGGPTPLSAKIGDSVYDSSALTGAAAGPAGAATISYAFYTNSICTLNAVSETPTANTFTSPGPPPDSNAFTFTQAGTYYWQAVYSGDANNVGATSPCNEVLVVAQNSPTLATTLHDTTAGTSQAGGPTPLSAKIGDSVYDSSALTGAAAGPAGAATISYAFYTNSICTLNAVSETPTANTFTSPGPPPDSNAFTFTQAGTYYWQAVYSGDANNVGATSPCNEVLVVAQNSPTLATTLHDTTAGTSQAGGPTPLSAKIGDSVYDSSALTGAAAGPAGAATISYAFYTNSICTLNAVSETPTANTFTSPGPPPDSNAFTFTQAGTYYWQAVYSGDANNVGATSPCNEVLVVAPSEPILSTTLHDSTAGTSAPGGSTLSAKIGDSVYDSSALTGAAAGPAGAATISYAFYTNSICTLNAVSETPTANTFTSPGPPPDSNAFTFTQAGTYYWQAVYSGDANNVGATSPCNETLVVAPNSPTLSTVAQSSTASNTGFGDLSNGGSISAGTYVRDTATLSGAATPTTGTVVYRLYNAATCIGNTPGGTVIFTDTETLVSNLIPPSLSTQLNSAGSYQWQAVYSSGNGQNNGATSTCGTETFTVASPQVSQITPTQTTCSQFASGTAATLSQVQYSLKSGKISQVNPGVLFYWVKVAVSPGETFTITQTTSEASKPFLIHAGSAAYTASCATAKGVTITQSSSTGTVTVKFSATASGTYYIGIKYTPSNVIGESAPAPNPTVVYSFSTTGVLSSTSTLDLVKK